MKEGVLALEIYTLPLWCYQTCTHKYDNIEFMRHLHKHASKIIRHVKRAEREGKCFKTRYISTNIIVIKWQHDKKKWSI